VFNESGGGNIKMGVVGPYFQYISSSPRASTDRYISSSKIGYWIPGLRCSEQVRNNIQQRRRAEGSCLQEQGGDATLDEASTQRRYRSRACCIIVSALGLFVLLSLSLHPRCFPAGGAIHGWHRDAHGQGEASGVAGGESGAP